MKLAILIVGLLVSGLLAAAYFEPSADASHIKRCLGEKPTMKNRSHDPSGSFLVGTAKRDVVIASPDADHVEGRGGRDVICGIGGNDELLGGAGSDRLSGGKGDDEIAGGKGDDLLIGGSGHDQGKGGPGRDTCVDIEVRTSCEVVQ